MNETEFSGKVVLVTGAGRGAGKLLAQAFGARGAIVAANDISPINVEPVVDGINAARTLFPNCWFDETECADGIDRLRRYRYRVVDGQLSQDPLHDENSNGADAFMTMGQGITSPKGRSPIHERLKRATSAFLEDAPGQGWMG